MSSNYKRWQKFFLFCFGLFVAAAFCMKWMEGDLKAGNEKFTVIGLEISYGREQLMTILGGLDERVRTILRYHLSFDFIFMVGVYPGIAGLCMMAREKQGGRVIRNLLLLLACFQLIAWICDIAENNWLFGWILKPNIEEAEFSFYHLFVWTKWVIVLSGALLSIPLSLRSNRRIM